MTLPLLEGDKKILVQQMPDNPRSGEGSAVRLRNGETLLVYSRFTGGGEDHDVADIYGGILDMDNGVVGNCKTFFPSPGSLNQMSVSLERLDDGVGAAWIQKTGVTEDDLYFSLSRDEGESWSEPVKVNEGRSEKYYVINNDRLRQFSSGRLAIPVALYPKGEFEEISPIGVFYSDDRGETWSLSECVEIKKENIRPPHRIQEKDKCVWNEAIELAVCQEPGVEELPDGRIMLYCRTHIGYMYHAFSTDQGETWSDLKAAPDIVAPCSPQSIRRIPGTDRLICVYNDRSHVSFADKDNNWNWRTSLSLAVSDDNAATWRTIGRVEDDSHNHCYISILFSDAEIFLTYYQSENTLKDGKPERRNLASLEMRTIPLDIVAV